jgi:hypothetical protein
MTRRHRLGALAIANIAFVATNVLHTLDHLRQGTGDLTTEVVLAGSVLTVVAVSTLWFTLRQDPRAPLVAAVVGLAGAAGIAASHLAPHWSALSYSYPALHVDALSWAAMLAELVAALAFGLLGVRELRRRGAGPRRPATPRTARAR